MGIGLAVQKGRAVHVYDERGWYLYDKLGELQGYTGTTVIIRQGGTVYFYDEQGFQTGSRMA
jgi:hypothetical protein